MNKTDLIEALEKAGYARHKRQLEIPAAAAQTITRKAERIAELESEVREARVVVCNGLDLVNDHDEAHDIHDPLYIWRQQAEIYLRPETAGFAARKSLGENNE